jgi:integrase
MQTMTSTDNESGTKRKARARRAAPADRPATSGTFAIFQERKAPRTLDRQQADLELFRRYLAEVGIATGDLFTRPEAWSGVTAEVVTGFVHWLYEQTPDVREVGQRLTTVKTYCLLAVRSGILDHVAYLRIRAIRNVPPRPSHEVELPDGGAQERAKPKITISGFQARQLKRQPTTTPQGRRDTLLMCLLLDQGLSCGEITRLRVEDLDLEQGTIKVARLKSGTIRVDKLSPDTLAAATTFVTQDLPPTGPLLPGSRKNGALSTVKMRGGKPREAPSTAATDDADYGMSDGAIQKRIRFLGDAIGIPGLSPQVCRRYWSKRRRLRYADEGHDSAPSNND